jgi:hypothetical protein
LPWHFYLLRGGAEILLLANLRKIFPNKKIKSQNQEEKKQNNSPV